MNTAELASLFDLDLDPRAVDLEPVPVDPKRIAWLRLKRLEVQRHYDPGWAEQSYLKIFGEPYGP